MIFLEVSLLALLLAPLYTLIDFTETSVDADSDAWHADKSTESVLLASDRGDAVIFDWELELADAIVK